MNKKDFRLVEQFINERPWKPRDVEIKVKKGVTEFKPIFETSNYDEALYNMLSNYISAGKCFVDWLKDNNYKIVEKKKIEELEEYKWKYEELCK